MIGAYTRGVLFVHSAPRALCPHIEWAAAEVLGSRVHLDWTEQPAAQGMMRAETSWVGPAGTGASLASALRDRIRAALVYATDPERMRRELDLALGQAWDDELEPFRYAGAGAPVRWLHRVG